MELDLTRLNSLAFMDFTGKKEAPKKPSETLKGEREYKTPIEVKKPSETLTEGLEGINKLQREADRKKQDIDRSLAICRKYRPNNQNAPETILRASDALVGGNITKGSPSLPVSTVLRYPLTL